MEMMFNIFRNKYKLKKEEFTFLKQVIRHLPTEYSYLLEQVNEDFILEKKPNELGDEHTFRLALNANLEDRFSHRNMPQFFILKDIFVWNKAEERYFPFEIHIVEGMIAGFRLEGSMDLYDPKKTDTSKLFEKHFRNEDKEELIRIMGDIPLSLSDKLDTASTFKIEISDQNFFVIKDYKNGNYLCVDSNGAIYRLIHDPYLIDKVFNNVDEFYDSWNEGKLDDLI